MDAELLYILNVERTLFEHAMFRAQSMQFLSILIVSFSELRWRPENYISQSHFIIYCMFNRIFAMKCVLSKPH